MNAEALGQQLRAAREARELTIEDVEQALRIRIKFLEAFETGAYEDLPGLVQARGFLRNYARYLGLDQDAILAEFDTIQRSGTGRGRRFRPRAAGPAVPVEPVLGDALAPPEASRARRALLIMGAALGLVGILAGCFLLTQLVEDMLNEQASIAGPDLVTILPTAPTLTPSATFEPSPTLSGGGAAVVAGPLITDRVVLRLNAVQRTWLRVIADGVVSYEGLVEPGLALQYQAAEFLTVQAANGSALEVVFNNLPIGLLGVRDQAVDRTFTPEMILTPTVPPTFTPSPTGGLPPATVVDGAPTALPALPGEGDAGAVPTSTPDAFGFISPTPLPQPGQPIPPTFTPPPVDDSSGAAGATQPVFPTPSATLPPPTITPSPTLTDTPTQTVSPTPTAILPPRITSTPTQTKQE